MVVFRPVGAVLSGPASSCKVEGALCQHYGDPEPTEQKDTHIEGAEEDNRDRRKKEEEKKTKRQESSAAGCFHGENFIFPKINQMPTGGLPLSCAAWPREALYAQPKEAGASKLLGGGGSPGHNARQFNRRNRASPHSRLLETHVLLGNAEKPNRQIGTEYTNRIP